MKKINNSKYINVIEILYSCAQLKIHTFHNNINGIKQAHQLFSDLIRTHNSDDEVISNKGLTELIKRSIDDEYYEIGKYKVIIKESE